MVKFYLKASAELNNVTDLQPTDTPESPHEYTFTIECTTCREQHDKPVDINCFESHEIPGSRGEASFVFKCHSCKSSHSATITRTSNKLVNQPDGEELQEGEESGTFITKPTTLVEIDARGIDFVSFIPTGKFECKSLKSTSQFEEVDLADGEWYDYDDNAGEEVSIVDVKWEISRK